jgi:ribonucleotide monophosphatase NagD (HAD superfamily)
MKNIKVAFDCNGTLLNGDKPNYKIIKLFKIFQSFGCEMYIWSNCGVEYVQEVADFLQLKAVCVVKNETLLPDITIDDSEYENLGQINLKVNRIFKHNY